MNEQTRRSVLSLAFAFALTLPWLLFRSQLRESGDAVVVATSGLAVLGAAFLLAWGAETAEKDVPRAVALAVLAVLAVAPEYAVDALYAWEAGMDPGNSAAGNLAIANMTGANRILIGLGWSGIALFALYRTRVRDRADTAVQSGSGWLDDAVSLDESISTEIVFLTLATLWAFFVPFAIGPGAPGPLGIDALDLVILVGLYAAYVLVIVRGDVDDDTQHVGVPATLQRFSKRIRVPTVLGLFAYSGYLILVAVEPFAHGLENVGKAAGIPAFFMIQWIAPLASESPELVITAYLVNKARTTASFNALISSKLNQWTLLVGTLVVVYSVALGRYGVLPFEPKQAGEIWLTAAQSFFALAILVNLRISAREALALLVLFVAQVLGEFLLIQLYPELDALRLWLVFAFTGLYLLLGGILFVRRRDSVRAILGQTRSRLPEDSTVLGSSSDD